MQNINGIYNEKLQYNFLEQLPTLRFNTQDPRKLRNLGESK